MIFCGNAGLPVDVSTLVLSEWMVNPGNELSCQSNGLLAAIAAFGDFLVWRFKCYFLRSNLQLHGCYTEHLEGRGPALFQLQLPAGHVITKLRLRFS